MPPQIDIHFCHGRTLPGHCAISLSALQSSSSRLADNLRAVCSNRPTMTGGLLLPEQPCAAEVNGNALAQPLNACVMWASNRDSWSLQQHFHSSTRSQCEIEGGRWVVGRRTMLRRLLGKARARPQDWWGQGLSYPATRCRPETSALPKMGSQSGMRHKWRMPTVRVSFWIKQRDADNCRFCGET